jgi:beta-N-acetylhexosaminidase
MTRRAGRLVLLAALALLVAACGAAAHASPAAPTADATLGVVPTPAPSATAAGPSDTSSALPSSAAPSATPAGEPAATPGPGCELPPLEVRVAQLLLTGIRGTGPTETSLGPVRSGVGGVLLLGSNLETAEQVRSLVDRLHAEAPYPLAIAIDEEPGRIGRLARAGIIDGSPSARALGREPAATVRATARRIGDGLAALGITVDLAPVLDVTGAAAGGVIGDRSFGSTPAVVTRAGRAFLAGLAQAGVAGVAKHFPGHGETTVDSHTSLPRVAASAAELRARAVAPFVAAIEDGVPAIMIGHLLVPALDPDRPATFSSPIVEGLLRDELGFAGLVMADDLGMAALDRWGDLARRTELAIAAGVDMPIVLDDRAVPDVIASLVEAVAAGRLPESRVDEAFLRVARFKGLAGFEGCAAR